jgi:hypothetical protein
MHLACANGQASVVTRLCEMGSSVRLKNNVSTVLDAIENILQIAY